MSEIHHAPVSFLTSFRTVPDVFALGASPCRLVLAIWVTALVLPRQLHIEDIDGSDGNEELWSLACVYESASGATRLNHRATDYAQREQADARQQHQRTGRPWIVMNTGDSPKGMSAASAYSDQHKDRRRHCRTQYCLVQLKHQAQWLAYHSAINQDISPALPVFQRRLVRSWSLYTELRSKKCSVRCQLGW